MRATSVCPGCDRSVEIPVEGGDAACALYAIQMRAVGLVYLANRDRLGWFRY